MSVYIEIDLASKTDLAAIVLLFSETDDDGTLTYAALARCDISEVAWRRGTPAIPDGLRPGI